jgi:serine/threonine-protein kinase
LSAAQKAVELDDKSSEAHASVAFASFWGKWDFATADREFQRAIELDPDNAVAHHWYATYLAMLRRAPEALTEIDRAQALDPASTSILADKGDILLLAGRTEESLTLLKQMEATEPKFISAPRYLKYAYYAKADYPNYLSEWRKEALLMQDAPSLALVTAAEKGFAAAGIKGMLTNTLQLQKKLYVKNQISPYGVARTCAELGEQQQALHYLNLAYEQHDDSLIALADDWAFHKMRDDAGYRELLARMNFPQN